MLNIDYKFSGNFLEIYVHNHEFSCFLPIIKIAETFP